MKKILCFLTVVCLFVTFLAGCEMPYGGSTEHTFLQSRENVVKVEICTNSNVINWREGAQITTIQPLLELSTDKIDSLWEELLKFPAAELRYVESGCGDLLFIFTYANGQQELIGYGEIGILNADGTFAGYRGHVLSEGERLAKLFAKYADPQLLREVSMSFRAYYK